MRPERRGAAFVLSCMILAGMGLGFPCLVRSQQTNTTDVDPNVRALSLARELYGSVERVMIPATKGHEQGSRCGTPRALELDGLLLRPDITTRVRDQIEALKLESVASLDKTYDTQTFTIDYNDTKNDPDMVYQPSVLDVAARNTAGGRVPVYVKKLGDNLESAWAIFQRYGFRRPISVGRINVDIKKHDKLGTTSYISDMIIDNNMSVLGLGPDLSNTETYSLLRVTAAHELFHKIQFRYSAWDFPGDPEKWISEGTARWAEDAIFDSENQYMTSIDVYLDEPERSLRSNGEGSWLDYGAVLFWKWLAEQYGTPKSGAERGLEFMRKYLESTHWYGSPLPDISMMIKNATKGKKNFDSAFVEFAIANFCKDLNSASYDLINYNYEENRELCTARTPVINGYKKVHLESNVLGSSADDEVKNLPSYASRFTKYNRGSAAAISIRFQADRTGSSWTNDFAVTILYLVGTQRIAGICRLPLKWDASTNHTVGGVVTLFSSFSGFDNVVVIVNGLEDGGSYQLFVQSPATDSFEPDNTFSTAKQISASSVGSLQYHSIHIPGDVDWVKFGATRFWWYTLETMPGNDGTSTDTYIELYNTNGITLIKAIDDGGVGKLSKMVWQAPSPGTYFLKIRHGSPSTGTGSYALRVRSSVSRPTQSLNIAVQRGVEYDDVQWERFGEGGVSAQEEDTKEIMGSRLIMYRVFALGDPANATVPLTGLISENQARIPILHPSDSDRRYSVYVYAVGAADTLTVTWDEQSEILTDAPTALLPQGIVLYPNYPNPFNPQTTIRYHLNSAVLVRLEVFDVLGRRTAILVDEQETAGQHQVVFDGTYLPSGVYIYHLSANAYSMSGRMILAK